MTRYFLDVNEELADRLKSIDDRQIVEALEQVADAHEVQETDELAPYDSIREIRDDDSLSEVKRKQLKIKAQRREDISTR